MSIIGPPGSSPGITEKIMPTFAILQENTVDGYLHWVQPSALISASGGPGSLVYQDRAAAERDLILCRDANARQIEATKRRKKKTHPCTYSIVEVTPTTDAEFSERARARYAKQAR